ncbi:MAG TPA: hypothetical protein VN317_01485 [Candidatus Methanoperedens sp.]|nr:hypothetical protein [Candidatus Methanoperedens sp.]
MHHLLLTLAVLSPMLFALSTGQIWEDFFISFRHSENLVLGNGLTYQAGQRIQGFSSPLAVLLAAGARWVAGAGSLAGTIWIIRAFGIAAFTIGLWLLLQAFSRGASAWTTAVIALLYVFDSKSVAFSTNGMETAFFMMFAAGSLASLAKGRAIALGFCWAGLQWTRPDGIVFIGLMAIAALLFSAEPRPGKLRMLMQSAAVCAAGYSPWIAFAWYYYGTPVPLTAQAKQALSGGFAPDTVLMKLRSFPTMVSMISLPPWAQFGGWHAFETPAMIVSAAAIFYWLIPRGDQLGRRSSFVACGSILYLCVVNGYFPWYFPPVFLFTLPALKAVLDALAVRRALRRAAMGVSGIVLSGYLYLWVDYAHLARATMSINEWETRRSVGLWLKENARRSDRVLVECPGYIGYFSGLRMVDYPGLVSPEVVAVNRVRPSSLAAIGSLFVPEWLVLRPSELPDFVRSDPDGFERLYEPAATFDRREQLLKAVPRHPEATYDSAFLVLKKKPDAAPR